MAVYRLLMVCCIALFVTSCSSENAYESEANRSADELQTVNRSEENSDEVFPVSAARSDLDEVLQEAQTRLVDRCMSDLGFEVRASPERATSELSIDQLLETRFGDLDEADAAERGIHRLLGEVEYSEDGYADFESLLERSGMGPSADVDYQLALTGGVGFSGGCVGAAQRELFGEDPLDPTSLRERIAALATESTESAPEVLAAGNDWSSCVEAAGFPAQNPTDLMERYTARAPVPDQAERDAAIAGVRCYEQSGLIDVWLSVRSRTEQELAEKHALELAEIEQRRAAAAERAAVLLNGTGDSPSADGP